MEAAKHTPTPWELDEYLVGQIINADGTKFIARAGRVGPGFEVDPEQVERNANAAFIVRAVNSHEQLVAALRDVTDVLDAFGNLPDGMLHPAPWNDRKAESKITAARAALAAAEAK